MAPRSGFETLLKDVGAAVDASTKSGRGQHLRRAPLLRQLVEWVVLRREAPALVELKHGFKSRFKAMEPRRDLVACAIHATHRYGVTLKKAAKLADIKVGDCATTQRMAKLAGVSLAELARNTDQDIRSAVDSHFEKLEVGLDQRAVEDLLLSALEAYEVPKPGKGQKYTEAYGYCFGTRRDFLPEGRGRRFRRVLNVTRVVTQLRSRATASEVHPNTKSEEVHLRVASELFDHLTVLGDYHTHPFKSLLALKTRRGWQSSPSDRSQIVGWAESVRHQGGQPRFSLIAAVARGGKTGRVTAREKANRIRFCVQGVFVVLAGYRIKRDGSYDEDVLLTCPGVE